jgi:hypothetical protein
MQGTRQMPTEQQISKKKCIGLAIHYIKLRVQQKDMHWTGTLKVKGRGAGKENIII